MILNCCGIGYTSCVKAEIKFFCSKPNLFLVLFITIFLTFIIRSFKCDVNV